MLSLAVLILVEHPGILIALFPFIVSSCFSFVVLFLFGIALLAQFSTDASETVIKKSFRSRGGPLAEEMRRTTGVYSRLFPPAFDLSTAKHTGIHPL